MRRYYAYCYGASTKACRLSSNMLRSHNQPHGPQSQLKYGERRINGRMTEFKKEQRIIATVQEMIKLGLSLRQIAKNLSLMGIPTKCNGKKWHPEMVKRIVKPWIMPS
jgi:hypothetical protein